MGLDQTCFIDLFYLKDVTNKFLELTVLLRVSGPTPYVTGKEVGAIRQDFFANVEDDKDIGNGIGNKAMGRQKTMTFLLLSRSSTPS